MLALFFFQAEDGIRDADVTGVQTCALPISHGRPTGPRPGLRRATTPVPAGTRQPVGAPPRSGNGEPPGLPALRSAGAPRAHPAAWAPLPPAWPSGGNAPGRSSAG